MSTASAASAREVLEAAIRRTVTANGRCADRGRCTGCESGITHALDAADAYASAFGADLLDQMARTRRTSDRRDALAAADGKPS